MQTIRITTTQNVDIDYELAGFGDRFLARLIDYALFFGLYFVCIVVFFILGGDTPAMGKYAIFILIGIWFALCVFYDLLCEIFFNGQTIGKRGLKIKVISLSGSRPTVGQYLLRWVFRLVDFGITGGGCAVVSMALTQNRQRLGDLMAGTAMVKVASASQFNDLVFAPAASHQEVSYPEVAQLTDEDVVLIHDVLRNFNSTRNSTLVYKLTLKLKSYLHISAPENINDYQFLEIVLNDYKFLSAGSAEA